MASKKATSLIVLVGVLASLVFAVVFILPAYASKSPSISAPVDPVATIPFDKQRVISLSNSTSSGSFHKGNYVWGGAMNICWDTLSDEVIGEPLRLGVESGQQLRLFQSLSNSKFSKEHLNPHSYYTKAGYGPKTQDTINKEVKLKFPNKTFPNLDMFLRQTDIISYAYFMKQVQYLTPFTIETVFFFQNTIVKGFKSSTTEQMKNVRVCKYTDPDKFIIKLQLKENKEQLYLIKGMEGSNPEDVVSELEQNLDCQGRLKRGEMFSMPVIDLDVRRECTELIGAPVLNKGFESYSISAMYENIKFKMDETGATVQNEAVISMKGRPTNHDKRYFILNSPFWVIMKEKSKQPYLVLGITNIQFMTRTIL